MCIRKPCRDAHTSVCKAAPLPPAPAGRPPTLVSTESLLHFPIRILSPAWEGSDCVTAQSPVLKLLCAIRHHERTAATGEPHGTAPYVLNGLSGPRDLTMSCVPGGAGMRLPPTGAVVIPVMRDEPRPCAVSQQCLQRITRVTGIQIIRGLATLVGLVSSASCSPPFGCTSASCHLLAPNILMSVPQ